MTDKALLALEDGSVFYGVSFGFFDFVKGETIIKKKDFGSTLASLNVSEGPFLMVPFCLLYTSPSPRD